MANTRFKQSPEKLYARKTWTRAYKKYDTAYQFTATAEIHSLGEQAPYFSVTGWAKNPQRRDDEWGGACHDDIVAAFPFLERYIKWHLFAWPSGPMHYLANTLWHAGDRDCWGLRLGEKQQIKNGKTGLPGWELVAVIDGVEQPIYKLPNHITAAEAPEAPVIRYSPWCRVGEGKVRDLNAARRCAVWFDATDEQLLLPPDELKQLLIDRLPKLLDEFQADMTELFGDELVWVPAHKEANDDDHAANTVDDE